MSEMESTPTESGQATKLVAGLIEGITSPEAVAQGLLNLPARSRQERPIGTDVDVDPENPVVMLYHAFIGGQISAEDYRTVVGALKGEGESGPAPDQGDPAAEPAEPEAE